MTQPVVPTSQQMLSVNDRTVEGRPGGPLERSRLGERVVFRFEDGEAVGVDLIDYH